MSAVASKGTNRNEGTARRTMHVRSPDKSLRSHLQNDGIIMALLVVMRRLCGAFLLQVFII
jgi:hypothetical protein